MTRILRTTLIMVALFAATHFAHAQTTAVASGNWSSAATWGGTVPTGTEEDIVIPMGIDVLLDMDVECGELLVQGRLEVQRANRNLTCDSLIVMGANAEFEAGTDANRFTQRFVLTLKGETTENFEHHGHDMGARALLAMMGGTITMHGEDRVEWTRLGANVGAGATAITMSEAVDWRAGDEILICSSRLDWNEAEKMQVGSVTGGGLTVNLTSALAFPHLGVVKTYTRPSDSKQWTGDMRAEVGLLTRNITIQGAADSEATGFGAHVMIHGSMTVGPTTYPSGEAYVKGVEIFRGGQKSLLARYPFHWHLCEDAGAGQYFNDNSVHLSFNRAITIHGTDFATVENNFCYDHIGHGLFLEDGVERFNVIRRNVLVLTKRPAAGEEVIPSDNSFNEAQNRTPASFWITNPRNTFEDNVVAGTEGTAYWFIMPTGPTGPSASRAYYNGARPNREPLESFARNSAHSCMNGFDIFDILASNHSITRNGGWINNNDHIMDSCTFYANNTAIYAGIGTPGYQDNVIYRNNVFIDNQIVTMLATYLQVQESVIVADSGEGLFTDERKLFRAYDGAGQIRDSHLIGWNANNANLLFNTGGAIKHVNNRFAGITTDHAGTVRASMTDFDLPQQADAHANHVGHPRFWSLILRDEDGSLSGVPNSSIISNHRFMRVGDETQPANWTCVYSSPHHFVTAIEGAGANNVSVKRSKAGTPDAWIYYIHGYQEHHQLPFIVNEDFLYTYYYESLPSSRRTDFRIDDATAGDTVVARFKDFGKLPGVSVNTTAHGSLAALNASGSTGYYVEANGDLYLKMVATGQNQSRRVSWSSNPAWNEWDSDGDGLTDGTEAAIAARDPFNVTDMGAQFDTNGDFELWDQLSNITGGQVTGGSLIGTSTGDSQIINGDLGFAASDISVLMLRFKATVNTAVELFWERSNAPGYSGTRQTQVDYTTPGVWQVLFIPVDSHAEWNDTITGLRIDPIAGAGDFEIDWIRASNGDADGDGIPDMTEGFGDPDGDGLANLDDTESDGDGTSDAAENAAGRDPYNASDLGFKFSTDGDFEGWSFVRVSGGVSSGLLSGTATGPGHPNIQNTTGFRFAAGSVTDILIRLRVSSTRTIPFFFGTDTANNFSGTRRLLTASPSANQWGMVSFPVSTHADWTGFITRLRFDPTLAGATLDVDWILATDGDRDDDGLTDAAEGHEDADSDGSPNLDDRDSDGDGAPDAIESGFGRNPYANVEGGLQSDADGQNDLLEMIAGFSPVSSVFFFSQSVLLDPNGDRRITFSAKPNRTYQVERSRNLATWQQIGQVQSGSTDGNMDFVDAESLATGPVHYRLMISVVDGDSAAMAPTMSLTINEPPVATAQGVTVTEDVPKSITLNGSDPDMDPLTFAVLASPTHGSLSGSAPNLTYTPNAHYHGPDSFTFRTQDGIAFSPAATVTITVTPVPDPPVANAQSVNADEDNSLAVTLTGFDGDMDPLTFAVVTPPNHGSLNGTAPNLTYTPNANYHGPDSFTFKVNDGSVDSAASTISLTVDPVNDPPVATAQSGTLNEDASLPITLAGSDIENDPLTFAVATGPSHGSLSGTAPNLTYTPNANYFGPDSFTFKANDGTVDSAAATVSLTVNPLPDAPVANTQSVNVDEDNSLPITLTGSDADNDPLTFAVAAGPSHGSLSGTAPNLTYTPNGDYHGPDSFTFKVNDGSTDSPPATNSITVDPVNDAPVFADQTLSIDENSAVAASVDTLTASDVDTGPSGTLSYTILSGNDAGIFSLDSASGAITIANAALNFEATSAYFLQVRVGDGGTPALDATATVTINVLDVNEAPTVSPQVASLNENTPNATPLITVSANDVDAVVNGNLTFDFASGNELGAFAIAPMSGAITVADSSQLDFETTSVFSLTVRATDGGTPGLTGTAIVTVNVVDLNEAPVLTDATLSVDENTAGFIQIGSVGATDPDAGLNGSVTHSIIADNGAGAFSINPISGNITVASSAPLDFESNPSFTLTVRAVDRGTPPLSSTATITINVTDLNEAPVISDAIFALNENSAAMTAVGTPISNDQDGGANGTLTHTITAGNASGAFSIDPAGGAISVANSTLLNFEATPQFTLTVQATDGGTPALSESATIIIKLNDLNETPTAPDATFAVNEHAPAGTFVGSVDGNDQDAGENGGISYLITAGNSSGAFAINPGNGDITVNTSAPLDFETTPTFVLSVLVEDRGIPRLNTSATITINLNDLNEAPTISDATFAINENSSVSTAVGTAVGGDSDAGVNGNLGYSIVGGNSSGAFAIDAANGAITVADMGPIDFETNPSFPLTVQVADGGTPSLTDTATITVNLIDLNEAPTLANVVFALNENSPNSTRVGTLPGMDQDSGANGTVSYGIVSGNESGVFALDAGSGAITVADSAQLNFESRPTYTLTVSISDRGTPMLSDTATVTINLNDLNEAPMIADATIALAENSPATTLVGTTAGSDGDAGANGTISYSIVAGNSAGAFTIDPGSGAITVANAGPLDFETNPTFALTVQAVDGGTPSLADTATITVNLTDLNEAPMLADVVFASAENSPNTTPVGTLAGTDQDAGANGTFTYSILAGNESGAFALDDNSGALTVADATQLNFESGASFALTINISDGGTPSLSDTATVTVNLGDLNEAPTLADATIAVAENSPAATAVGNAVGNDADTGVNGNLSYAIVNGNSSGAFTIDPGTGAITVADAGPLDFETTPTFTLTVEVADGGTPALTDTATITVKLTDLNETPTLADVPFAVDENSPNSTPVGTPTGSDNDAGANGTVSYSIVSGNDSGAFALDASSGAITVADSTQLNFESNPAIALTVRVSDGGTPSLSDTAIVTINLNDLNEVPLLPIKTFTFDENLSAGSIIGNVGASDPDTGANGTLTHFRTNITVTTGLGINSLTGDIFVTDPAPLDFENNASFNFDIAAADGGTPRLVSTTTFSAELNDINEAPTFQDVTLSLDENSPNSSPVGTLAGSDQDAGANGTVTYAIESGNGSGAFALDANSGAITVADSTQLNFESNPSIALTVRISDGGTPPLSATANVTINLNDVNEAPTLGDLAVNLAEDQPNGFLVGNAPGSDPDTGLNGTLNYSITSGNDSGAFTIDASSGAVTVADTTRIDFESGTTFALTVMLSDSGTPSLTDTGTINITVLDANEAPVINDANFTLNENEPLFAPVGTVTGTDQDVGANGDLLYTIVGGNASGAFIMSQTSGNITVGNPSQINFESNPSFSLTVQATDGGNPALNDTATVNITLTDLNEAPVASDLTVSLDENSAAQLVVGSVNATDLDTGANGTLTYTIASGNASGAFAVDGGSGQIKVANRGALDFETTPVFTLTVNVSDGGTPALSDSATVTINLDDLNEAPTVSDVTLALDENSADQTAVGTLSASDQDSGVNGNVSYVITAGNDSGAFALAPANGNLSVANSALLDFEQTPVFTLTVEARDSGTPSQASSFTATINLNDLNEAPSLADQTLAVDENSANQTVVGSAAGVDVDAGVNGSLNYSSTAGNDSGAFAIDPTSGEITVADTTQLDFETTNRFTLTIQVADGGTPPLTASATFTIDVNDVNEAPTANDLARSLDENRPNGTFVGTVGATDPDAGNAGTLSYAITAGDPNNAFTIDPGTGVITVADRTQINFEVNQSFSLIVTVSDAGTPAQADTASVNITINDLNEAPSIGTASFAIDENSAAQTPLDTVTGTDPDAGPNGTLTYAITSGNTGGAFTIDANSGAITVANASALNFEVTPAFSLTITVTDGGTPALIDTGVITVTVNDLNEAPRAFPGTMTTIENAVNTATLGAMSATDEDRGPNGVLRYSIVGGSGSTALAIDAVSGTIYVQDSTQLDFETTPSLEIQVKVADMGTPSLSDTNTVTLQLIDLNEAPSVYDQTFAVDENSPFGTVVASLSATDPDAGLNGTLRYAITGGNQFGTFAIDANSGEIRVAAPNRLNYEARTSFTFSVRVTDRGVPTYSDSAQVTINVNDVNEAPGVLRPFTPVTVTTVPATIVSNLTLHFADIESSLTELTYTVSQVSNGNMVAATITDGTNLTVTVNSGFTGSGTITVRATDPQGLFAEAPFRINVPSHVNPPSLTIEHVGGNIRIRWPSSELGWIVESCPFAAPSAPWVAESTVQVVFDGWTQVDMPMTGPSRFYRIRRP